VVSSVPSKIASFLGLSNACKYSGHSLRVSSATVLADSGANTLTLKRHGRWSSESVAEDYVRQSKAARCDTAALLAGASSVSIIGQNNRTKPQASSTIVFTNCVFNRDVVLNGRDKS
jgi:hypothetical protein